MNLTNGLCVTIVDQNKWIRHIARPAEIGSKEQMVSNIVVIKDVDYIMTETPKKDDWVGIFKGNKPTKCPICGGTILVESYVGIKPDGTIYCKRCVTDEVIKRQAAMLELKTSQLPFYI